MSDKLQKLLAHAGLGSRREIETWISDGRITVNGKRAKLGDRATALDRILIDGQLQALNSRRDQLVKGLIYHKPEGVICTRNDPKGRPTMFDELPAIPGGRWVSVGRLDINTSGLILLTNSGDLANKLMHPSTGLEREYLVRIRGRATADTIEKLTRKGVEIDGKPARFESVVEADMAEMGTNHWYRIVIKEGRYREVRRMWDVVGHTVSRLKRIRYGTIKLTRDLKRGQHVKMAPMQLEKLVNSVELGDEFKGQLYSSGRSSSADTKSKTNRSKSTQSAASDSNGRRRQSTAGEGSSTRLEKSNEPRHGRTRSSVNKSGQGRNGEMAERGLRSRTTSASKRASNKSTPRVRGDQPAKPRGNRKK